ncbi:MAG: TonB-dependent receptor, partial [Steroidobacteraceae bacterium]
AQKRMQNQQDVPISLSAFSGDELVALGTTDVQQLQAVTPGLIFTNTSSVGSPYLRGVGTRFANVGLEPSVATYVDDRYVARSSAGFMTDFVDVERVEVLKGPQGTLYGRNAAGGAIRLVTKDVSDKLEGKVTGTAGNYDYYGLSGTVNVPFSDTFGGRFTAVKRKRDGFAENISPVGRSDLDDRDFQAYRAKFRWNATDTVTARLSFDYWESDDTRGSDLVDVSPPAFSTGIARGGITGTHWNDVATIMNTRNPIDEFSSQLRIDASFEPFDFASITTYGDMDNEFGADADGTTARVLDSIAYEDEEAFSQEFQLLSNGTGAWEWLVGAFFYTSDGNIESTIDGGGPSYVSASNQNVVTDAWAVFGQTVWHFADRWSLTLGGRWSSEKKKVKNEASKRLAVTIIPVPFRDKEDWSDFTPKATIDYKLDSGLVYLSYAQGFKSGGFNTPAVGSQPLDPEVLDMFELGYKGDLLNNRMRLNVALFYYDYKDLQITRAAAGTLPALTTTENAANSTIKGVDMDLSWLVTDRLTLSTGMNILDSEYKNYDDATAKSFAAVATGNPNATGVVNIPFNADGRQLLRAPDWSAFVSARYELPIGSARMPATISYSYKDDYEYDFVADPFMGLLKQKGYGLLTARVGYVTADEKWEFSAWGDNLTDEKYYDDVVGITPGLRASYGTPRTYGVDISYNF